MLRVMTRFMHEKILICCFHFMLSFVLAKCRVTIEPDFGRLNIQVGKILDVTCHLRHPELALIRVDFAKSSPKVVLSSNLYGYKIPLGHLRNKKTLFLMNMIEPQQYNISYAPEESSDGILLLADDGVNADILDVPRHAVQGDIIEVEGYVYRSGSDLDAEVFEKISTDLRIDSQNVATYKDKPFTIRGEGFITTKVVYDCPIIAI